MKLGLPQEVLKKYSNIESHKNLSGGRRVVSRGRKDGRMERQT